MDRARIRTLLLQVMAALVPLAIILFLVSAARAGRVPRGEILRVTQDSRFEGEPSLSPDGRSVAYRCDTGSAGDICIVAVSGGPVRNLTRTTDEHDAEPAFSPRGDQIAFRRGRGIALISPEGGESRMLVGQGTQPAWTPDGAAIYYSVESQPPPGGPGRMSVYEGWRVEVATGITAQYAIADFKEPAVSPHGQRVAYVSRPVDMRYRLRLANTNGDVWTRPITGGTPVRVTYEGAAVSSPMWSADGRYLYYVSSRQGSRSIWRVRIGERSGRVHSVPERVPTAASEPSRITRSADGGRLMWSDRRLVSRGMRVGFDTDARRTRGDPADAPVLDDVDVRGEEAIDLTLERQVPGTTADAPSVTPPGPSLGGRWSPDRTMFAGATGGNIWIYTPARGSYEHFRQGANPIWLNDSRRLVYDHDGRLFLAEAVLKISRELVAAPDQQLSHPGLSRDNTQLFYTRTGVDADLWVMNTR
jgi:dipeptidyl aminopeptidase/acylaminoacyl peptidase